MGYFPGSGSSEFFKKIKIEKCTHTHTHNYTLQIQQTESCRTVSFLLNGKSKNKRQHLLANFIYIYIEMLEMDLICSKSFNLKVLRVGPKKKKIFSSRTSMIK